jgi:hypothetical protein
MKLTVIFALAALALAVGARAQSCPIEASVSSLSLSPFSPR